MWVRILKRKKKKNHCSDMVVKTKYDIGDQVWYMSDNKINESDVTGLNICIDKTGKLNIEYTLHFNDKIAEPFLFGTKDELIESL